MMCLCRMLRICYNFVRGADRMKEEFEYPQTTG